jgi:hypothetical protein
MTGATEHGLNHATLVVAAGGTVGAPSLWQSCDTLNSNVDIEDFAFRSIPRWFARVEV